MNYALSSHIIIPAAIAALSELIFPLIGIVILLSHLFAISSGRPFPSLPIKTAAPLLKEISPILSASESITEAYVRISEL